MSIAFGSLLASINSTTNASSYATGSFTPTASALLIVAIEWDRATISSSPSLSGGSLTWNGPLDQIGFDSAASPSTALAWFWAAVSASPSSMTVTADFGGETQTGCIMHVFDLTGTSTTLPRVQAVTGTADAATSISATLGLSLQSGSTTLAFIGNNNNIGITERASWTEIGDLGHATPPARLETQYYLTGETTGSGTKTGGGANIALGIIVIEIAQAASVTTAQIAPALAALTASGGFVGGSYV